MAILKSSKVASTYNTDTGVRTNADKSTTQAQAAPKSVAPAYNAKTGAATGKPSTEYTDYLKSLNSPSSSNFVPEPTDAPGAIPAAGGTGIDTGQPSPEQAASYVVKPGDTLGGIAKSQGVAVGDISGYKSGNPDMISPGENLSLGGKYKAGLAAANATGQPAPDNTGKGLAAVGNFVQDSKQEPPSPLGGIMEVDSNFDSIFTNLDKYMEPLTQKKSLVQEYQSLTKQLGIQDINEELINAKKIIEGTEDDIRSEVQAASGFATDSQVLALANSRNKSLVKNYNVLLESRDNAMQQLNTMMDLTIEDRKAAEADFDRKMNFTFKIAEFKERAVSNAKEGYNNIVKNLGYDGLYSSLQQDPSSLALVEKTLGFAPGGLAQASTQSAKQRSQELADSALDRQYKQAQISNIYSQIDERNNPADGFDPSQIVAYAQQYASTGTIPTGLPKGTFGAVAQYAKELPKPEGTLVDINTGVKSSKIPAALESDIVDLKDLVGRTDRLKTLYNSTGIFSSQAQRAKYNSERAEAIDIIGRLRTGAVMNPEEKIDYAAKIPPLLSVGTIFSANRPSVGNQKIDSFGTSMAGKLDTILKTNGASIYGYSTVNLGGKDYKVGDVITDGTQSGRVNPDGSITLIQ